MPARSLEERAPGVEALPGTVAGDHGQVGGEAGGHLLEVAVPAAADGAAVEADGLVVEGVERGEEEGPPVAGLEEERPAGRRTVGQQEEAVEGLAHDGGEAELAVLVGEGLQVGGAPPSAARSAGVKTGQPTEGWS